MRWVHDAENYFCMGAGRLLNREKAEATSNAEVTGCPASDGPCTMYSYTAHVHLVQPHRCVVDLSECGTAGRRDESCGVIYPDDCTWERLRVPTRWTDAARKRYIASMRATHPPVTTDTTTPTHSQTSPSLPITHNERSRPVRFVRPRVHRCIACQEVVSRKCGGQVSVSHIPR
jgi:hypothetical protein